MSKYKLTFKLKQHTPIIHFQYDQTGATLRATELKPKLDRFLIDKMGGLLAFDKYKNFLIGDYKEIEQGLKKIDDNNDLTEKQKNKQKEEFLKKQHLALDYKVRVEKINSNKRHGNVILIPPVHDQWVMSEGVYVTVFSFNTEILKKIDKYKNEFFVFTNFGKRQSKGFGCFLPENLKNDEFVTTIKKLINSNLIQNSYKLNQSLRKEPNNETDNNSVTYFYTLISRLWSRIKSGKNFRGYEKSRVFEYLELENLRWDKRWIKRKLKDLIDNGTLPEDLIYRNAPIDIKNINSWSDNSNEEYRFGRAMLGLAEHYEYRANNNYLYQVIIDGGEIERYKSPVTFKIFNKEIYLIINKENYDMFNKNFSIKIQKKQKQNGQYVNIGHPIVINDVISTPLPSEFLLYDFFEKITNNNISNVGISKII